MSLRIDTPIPPRRHLLLDLDSLVLVPILWPYRPTCMLAELEQYDTPGRNSAAFCRGHGKIQVGGLRPPPSLVVDRLGRAETQAQHCLGMGRKKSWVCFQGLTNQSSRATA